MTLATATEGAGRAGIASPDGRLRVAFLAQNSVLPLDNGSRIRNAALLSALVRECETTLVLSEAPDGAHVAEFASMGLRVVHVPKPRGRIARSVTEFVRGAPLSMAVQRNPSLDVWLWRHAGDFDAVVAGTISRAPHGRAPALPPVIVDTQNVEFLRYGRARTSEGRVQAARRMLFDAGMKRFERRILRGRVVIACSEVDCVALRSLGVEDVRTVPNGAWVAGTARRPAPTVRDDPRVVFVGDLGYGPNLQGAELLLNEVVPRVRHALPGCRFTIGGRGAPGSLTEAAKAAGVEVISPVPSMSALLATATAEVVPLLQGGGTRLKILEAFASGVPVVSTSIGAEGIAATDGEHLLIADDPAGMADAIVRLHRDPALSQRVTTGARALVESHYDWASIGIRFLSEVRMVALRGANAASGHGGTP